MAREKMTATKRKRLIRTYGSCPAGYTTAELESFLHLLYGLYHDLYTASELSGLMVSDPFDESAIPRRIRLVDLAAWLEALVS